ncbi:MAG: aspartate aminotransferase family protein [Gaiellaceae bacterium]
MTTTETVQLDRARIKELTARESRKLDEWTPTSRELFERAKRTMPSGVASTYQARDPWPIFLTRGAGQYVWDADGHRMIDYHNGFGSMVVGHAHPAIMKGVTERLRLGSHFSAPTEDATWVAEDLAERFGLPKWRFTNSGSEATMDAIRIARGVTGRDTILKILGSYHGHHDAVMVSVGFDLAADVDPDDIPSVPYGAGLPQAVADLTVAVPFNDADALSRRLDRLEEEGRLPACMIMEAAMMNLGVVLPEPGYLEAVRAETRRRGVLLIFDEVKTGLTIAPGGATERYGLEPDLVTLAKTLGGGFPTGAVGGTEEVMEIVEAGRVNQVGTFNGNPLSMAAARATLEEVLTPDAYTRLEAIDNRLIEGCQSVIDRYGLPGYAIGIGSKGCVTFSAERITDYRTFKRSQDAELTELAWLYHANRDIFMTPGREEEWTLSVALEESDADTYVAAFEELASDLTA